MLDTLRNTGRTTRLIEEAKRLHKQGKPVAIVVETIQQLCEIKGKVDLEIPVINCNHSEWDWNEMRQHGRPLDTDYLVDHYAIEQRYAKELKALHRFDTPTIKVG